MKTTPDGGVRCPRSIPTRITLCLAFLVAGGIVITGWQVWIMLGYGSSTCLTVNGRLCNTPHGECVNGVCVCEAYFSGYGCENTLVNGYSKVSGLVCTDARGILPQYTNKSHIYEECVEEIVDRLGKIEKVGGWNTPECLAATQAGYRRLEDDNATIYDLFALPICQCKDGKYAGYACNDDPCPKDESFAVCGNWGNTSVTYTHNLSSSGLGCQCTQPLVNYLSNSYITRFSVDKLRKAQHTPRLLNDLTYTFCGTPYAHPDDPGLMVVYNRPFLQGNTHKCFCQKNRFGRACNEGACPSKNGKICGGNGHPGFGAGAETNSTVKYSVDSTVVCLNGTVNCKDTDSSLPNLCVSNTAHCSVKESVCPTDRPVRCRDSSCTAAPSQPNDDYAFGIRDNLTEVVINKMCNSLLLKDPTTFLTGQDYSTAIQTCLGSNGSVVDGVLFPNGEVLQTSSLVLLMVETVSDTGTLTMSYRTTTHTLQETDVQGRVHYFVFEESYEEEQHRLFIPIDDTRVIRLVDTNEIEIVPSPFVIDITGGLIPSEWAKVRLTTDQDPSKVYIVDASSLVVEYTEDGDWFIANQTLGVLMPGGAFVTLDDCMESIDKCIWNVETRLSVDGTRKFCGSGVSSTRLSCAAAAVTGYIKLQLVLRATGPSIEETHSIDWTGLGPWNVGPSVSDLKDEDFTKDSDYFTFTASADFSGLRSVAFIQLIDLLVPGACSHSSVNASTLNNIWWNELARRSTNIHVGLKAIGQTRRFGVDYLVRGTVVSDSYLNVRGYDDLVPVSKMKQITSVEFRRGLPHESFRVFPAMCIDGTPTHYTSASFQDVVVTCSCTLSFRRKFVCQCSDDFREAYQCSCDQLTVDGNSTGCSCGNEPGVFQLEQQIDTYRQEVESVCFLSSMEDPSGEALVSGVVSIAAVVSDDNGTVFVNRTSDTTSAVYLLEFRIEGECVSDEALGVEASSTVFSDVVETFEFESSCLNISGVTYQTIKPLYDPYKSNAYDQWWIYGLSANISVVPVFIPAGIPLTPMEVQVTSNEDDKDNVIWNNLDYWHSTENDPRPTLTLLFNGSQIVIGVFIVFETVAINQTTVILPLTVDIQATTNGLNWNTLGTVRSDVYHGSQDYWFPVLNGGGPSGTPVYTGIRLRSKHYLGVREFIAMTNQRCDLAGIRLETSPGFSSITSHEITHIIDRRLNDSQLCVCTDACIINGQTPRPGIDACADEKYMVEELGYPVSQRAYYRDITVDHAYFVLTGSTVSNVTGLYEGYNASLFLQTHDTSFKAWYLVGTTPPPLSALNLTWTGSIVGVNLENDSAEAQPNYFYRVIDLTIETWDFTELDSLGFPVYNWFKNQSLVERGLACLTGTHCSECGTSNRLDTIAKGVTCTLTAYQQQVYNDFVNRSDHFIQDSAVLNEYLETELVVAKFDTLTFTRNYTIPTRRNCDDCGGLFRCPTGECVAASTDCSRPLYNSKGDGCTQSSPTSSKFTCVCKPGWAGSDCSVDYTQPGDPYTGKVNPFKWNSCGQSPPICVQAGTRLDASLDGAYTDSQLVQINTGGLALRNASDVRNIRYGQSFAPFCVRVLRKYYRGGRKIYTNCPHYARGPLGEKLLLSDCYIRNEDGTLTLKDFTYPNGTVYQIPWRNVTHYNEFGFRCPISGHCESEERDCYLKEVIEPACGDGGKCRADGTCECYQGTSTFTYTKEWTNITQIPYNSENPTKWNVEFDERWKFNKHCQQKDCSDGKCESIPQTCFPGTPELKFDDHHVVCPTSSGHQGFCAVDFQSCDQGKLTQFYECSGNGFPYLVDYRNEVRCKCGALATRLASFRDGGNVTRGRESTELKKNGWGGAYCQDYYCQDDPRKKRWTYKDELTLQPYVDDEGITLPGKYAGGSCGAVIGPDPDDIVQWENACPGEKRLERCNKVLCQIGKKVVATAPEECQGAERTQLVYSCNNKGRALADGTCECVRNLETGVGYGPDASKQGCFRRITCPIAQSTGRVCNQLDRTPDQFVQMPKIGYWEDQVFSFLIRAGYPATKEQLVKMAVPQPQQFENLQQEVWTALAIGLEQTLINARGSICVNSSDEDPADPPGMLSYSGSESVVGPFKKAFKFPYDVTTYTAGMDPILTDLKIQQYESTHSTAPRLDSEYVTTDLSISAVFSTSTFLTHIRLFALNPNTTNAGFRFSNELNQTICGDPFVSYQLPPSTAFQGLWTWVHVECLQRFFGFDFTTLGSAYTLACLSGTRSSQCLAWKDSVCSTISGAQIQTPASIAEYSGCAKDERCCVPYSATNDPISIVQIETDIPIYIQEIVLMGYTTTVLEMPTNQMREVWWKQGNITNETPHLGEQCLDDLHLMREEMLDQDGSLFVYQEFSDTIVNVSTEIHTFNYTTADAACKDNGGTLAISSDSEDRNSFARTYGQECCRVPAPGQQGTCTKECLVGARNINEMPDPVLTDFINSTCSLWGCCQRSDGLDGDPDVVDGPFYDFTHCHENDGEIYKTNWANATLPTLLSWETLFNLAFTEDQRQVYSVPISSGAQIPFTLVTTESNTIFNAGSTDSKPVLIYNRYRPYLLFESYKAWVNEGTLHHSAIDANNYYLQNTANPSLNFDYWAYLKTFAMLGIKTLPYSRTRVIRNIPSLTPNWNTQTTVADKGTHVEYWTQAPVCKVTLYSYDHCGQFLHGSAKQTFFQGAKKTYFIRPGDDYHLLGKNVLNGGETGDPNARKWTECADGTTSCPYYNQDVDLGDVSIRSISVEGPCLVEYHGAYENDDKPETYKYYTEESLFNPVGHRFGEYGTTGQPTPYGCFIGCLQDMVCAYSVWKDGTRSQNLHPPEADGRQKGVIFGSNLDSITDVYEYNYWVSRTIMTHSAGIKIFPLFNTYKVKMNFRAEATAPSSITNTGTCHMFWVTHPYMCMRIDVRVVDSVKSLPTTPTGQHASTQVSASIKDSRVNATARMLLLEPVLMNSQTGVLTTAHVQTMLGQGANQRLTSVFVPCQSLGREVKVCPSCVIEQPIGKWEFDPRKYFSDRPSTWVSGVTIMRQTFNGTIPPTLPRPELQVNLDKYFVPSQGQSLQWFSALSSHRYTKTRFYGGVIAAVKADEYHDKFSLDNCVKVRPTNAPTAITTPPVPYTFDTAVCHNPTYYALCIRDHTKYTVMRGRHCFPCGTSTRISGNPNPGTTVFDEFPEIIESDYPILHSALRALREGRIASFIYEQDLDYDTMFEYIRSLASVSLIDFFPEFREIIRNAQRCFSDRPGHLSDGNSQENPNNWIDVCITRTWPIDCGERCSKESGICRYRRAVSEQYCDPDAEQYPVSYIPDEDYPKDLQPVTDSEPWKISKCGIVVDPVVYYKDDQDGLRSISTRDFVVQDELVRQFIWLQITKEGRSSWQNTGKSAHKFVFRNTTTLFGEFECSANCMIVVWLAGLSNSYETDPANRVEVGTATGAANVRTSFTFDLGGVLNSTEYYRTLAWDIYNLTRGSTVYLHKVIASNPSTIADCQAERTWLIRNPESSFEYPAIENQCVWEYTQNPITGQFIAPGECYCKDPSLGGTTCEAPAVVSRWKGEKQVCGGFVSPGQMALDYDGNKVRVNADGSWKSLNRPEWGCKVLDPGLIFRTVFFPQTRFDFPIVYRTQSLVGELDFFVADRIEDDSDLDGDDITNEFLDLTLEEAGRSCDSESAALASFVSVDEVTRYLRVANATHSTFLDLELTNESLRWESRATDMYTCPVVDGVIECGTAMTENPCVNPEADLCKAIQWNNLAFLLTGTNITDGRTETEESVLVAGPVDLDLEEVTATPHTVKLFMSVNTTVEVWATNGSDYQCEPRANDAYYFDCSVVMATQIQIRAISVTATIREALVYYATDPTRFWGYYS